MRQSAMLCVRSYAEVCVSSIATQSSVSGAQPSISARGMASLRQGVSMKICVAPSCRVPGSRSRHDDIFLQQHAGQRDQRQADQGCRVFTVDALDQCDAQ